MVGLGPRLKGIPNSSGVYTLIIYLDDGERLSVGGIGEHFFPSGYYVYTGSALGRGPLSLAGRVSRHVSPRERRRWHIDYLLSSQRARVVAVVFSETSLKKECSIVKVLEEAFGGSAVVKGFGSSDCSSGCNAHLQHFQSHDLESLAKTVLKAHKSVGLSPLQTTF